MFVLLCFVCYVHINTVKQVLVMRRNVVKLMWMSSSIFVDILYLDYGIQYHMIKIFANILFDLRCLVKQK